jgi:hypothetical protein
MAWTIELIGNRDRNRGLSTRSRPKHERELSQIEDKQHVGALTAIFEGTGSNSRVVSED